MSYPYTAADRLTPYPPSMHLTRSTTRLSRAALRRTIIALALMVMPGTRALAAQDTSPVARPDTSIRGQSATADSTGADIAVIFPDSLPEMPRTMSELLAARVPGLSVQRSTGATGASSWISMRDAGAVQGLEPLFVVDGVRRVSSFTAYSPFNLTPNALDGERLRPSPIDDIPVDQVERVEVLRGPAAAARYGRDARYGVVVVTTRRPAQGRPRFRLSLTGGAADERATFPRKFANLDAIQRPCTNPDAAIGGCTQVSTSSYAVLRDHSPFRTGARQGAAFDASGGIGPVALALGASVDRADGVLPMDGTDRTSVTARLATPLGARVRLSMSAQTSLRGVTQPAQGSSSLELISGGVLGPAIDCSAATPCPLSSTSRGYRFGTPEYLAALGTRHRVQHFSEGATLDVAATPWLASQTSFSLDGMLDHGKRTDKPMPDDPYPVFRRADLVSHAIRWAIEESLRSTWEFAGMPAATTLAVRTDQDRSRESNGGSSYVIVNGVIMASGFSNRNSWTDRRTSIRLEQRASVGGRATIGVGALWAHTTLDNTPADTRPTLDGFADATVRLVDSANARRGLTSLRLRTAVGQVSGYDPRSLSNIPFIPLVLGFPGTQNDVEPLHPQRSTELEAGVDAAFAPLRLGVSVTAYRRTIGEPYVIILLPQPSSGNYGLTDMTRRLTGVELSARATLVDGQRLRWESRGHVALTHDRVTHWAVGMRAVGGASGTLSVIEEGRPFRSWLTRPVAWSDANGDGIISASELSAPAGAGSRFPARPTQTATLENSITILRALTVGAQLDYVGGHKVLDLATVAQCLVGTCTAINDPRASLAEQARGVAAAYGYGSAGYLESGATLRLRELSLSLGSARAATVARAGSLRVTVAARNLATWSRYNGLDPEIDLTAPGFNLNSANDYQRFYLPNARQLTARVTLAY